jgi:hypothetical protein
MVSSAEVVHVEGLVKATAGHHRIIIIIGPQQQ